MPADWINAELRRRDREKWERNMRASQSGGCLVIPLAVLPFLIGGFVVLVLVVHFAFSHSDFQKQMDAQHLTVVEPSSLQGRPKNADNAYDRGNAARKADLTKVLSSGATISAVYGSTVDDAIIVAASQGGFMKSANRIDALLGVPIDAEVVAVRSVDAGSFGGVAKCGTATVRKVAVAVCAWIDDGTAGAIAIYSSDVKKGGKMLTAVRAEVEKRI